MSGRMLVLLSLLACAMAEGLHARRSLGRSRKKTVLSPRILKFEHCPGSGSRHYAYVHNYTSTIDGHGVLYLNGVLEFLKVAKSVTQMKVVLHRCREAVSSNTCEYFATWPFTTAICDLIAARGFIWSGFMRAITPEFKCPLQATKYNVVNATLDLSLGESMVHMNIAGNVWNAEVQIFDQDRQLYSCIVTAVLINRVTIKS